MKIYAKTTPHAANKGNKVLHPSVFGPNLFLLLMLTQNNFEG